MNPKIGIRREDKNQWERRVPLTPEQVKQLVGRGIEVVVQPSPIRAFSDEQYRAAGARIDEDLSGCRLVFGVKEFPDPIFRVGGGYVYFAHVIKGQAHNMPMLRRLLDLGCTLIDYEKVTDDAGRRLIFFGRHAGLAGMIDTLWALGQRLKAKKIATPFSRIRKAHQYPDLDHALEAVSDAGEEIRKKGLPRALGSLSFGFTGYGNVSRGAQEVFDRLPHVKVPPEKLARAVRRRPPERHRLIKTVFEERHLAAPREKGRPFELKEYYEHPERFRPIFYRHVPDLDVVVNCIFWTQKYPRLITRDLLRGLYLCQDEPRLKVIGDISCDVEGAIEVTVRTTDSGDPVFTWLVDEDRDAPGVRGKGPVVLAVDNLPCELPVESSRDFGNALLPYVEAMARADFGAPFAELDLPMPIKRAVIAHQGKLTPDYAYLAQHLNPCQGDEE
jgi:alpha-aminoadipic semialdehyde synthase